MGPVHPDQTFPAGRPAPDLAGQLADLKAHAGLTATQVGRLLGVPARTIQAWTDWSAPAGRAELIGRLAAMIRALPGETPADRRAALLDSSTGPSPFHSWLAALPSDAVLQGPAVPVRDRLAAEERRHSVRRMTAADAPAAAGLFDSALGAGYVDPTDLAGYATAPGRTGFVAEDPAGRLVAAATGLTAPGPALLGMMPADQRPALLDLLPAVSGPAPVGLLKSVAVAPDARRAGLGVAASDAVLNELTASGAANVFSIGWTDGAGCHIERALLALGFEARGDLPGFWTADSLQHGYACPTCRHPCRCTARIFTR